MHKVASLAQIPWDRGLLVEVDDEKILLVHDGGAVKAYAAVCPHAGAPLEEGAICDGRIICPWHKGAFHVSDGSLAEPPALQGLDSYPIAVTGDDVFVGSRAERRVEPPLPTDNRLFVIVGAGAAGTSAAGALREFGFGGRILMIGREPGLPYDRTSLSKFVLAGQMKPQETPLLQPAAFYELNKIERIEAEVVRLDVAGHELSLANGCEMAFDSALVCTGGDPVTPTLPGFEKKGVHLLRSLEDAGAILNDVKAGTRAIVLGSSFIGLEVASCLRAQNAQVTVVDPEPVPFARQFGEPIGRSIRTLHETNGVVFETPAKATSLQGDVHVRELVLEDGRRLAADLVVVGVGVRPATSFVEGARLAEDGGLIVDDHFACANGVYAAGDIAVHPVPPEGKPTRIEHWRVAQSQARAAAGYMVGRDEAYETVPYFWTYHYGKNFEYLGHAERWSEQLIFGDVGNNTFVSLLLQGERVVAIVACGLQRTTASLIERMHKPLMRDDAVNLVQTMSSAG